jgi:microcystin-dependent protein
MGDVLLTAAKVAGGIPALGQILQYSDMDNRALDSLLGNKFGGDRDQTFALPNLQGAAPNGLTYYICVKGRFPSREPGRY